MSLHRNWSGLRDTGAAGAYLRSAVVRGCRSRQRRFVRAPAGARSGWRPVPAGGRLEEIAVDTDEAARVAAAVRALPTRQREVVVARYYLGVDRGPDRAAAAGRARVGQAARPPGAGDSSTAESRRPHEPGRAAAQRGPHHLCRRSGHDHIGRRPDAARPPPPARQGKPGASAPAHPRRRRRPAPHRRRGRGDPVAAPPGTHRPRGPARPRSVARNHPQRRRRRLQPDRGATGPHPDELSQCTRPRPSRPWWLDSGVARRRKHDDQRRGRPAGSRLPRDRSMAGRVRRGDRLRHRGPRGPRVHRHVVASRDLDAAVAGVGRRPEPHRNRERPGRCRSSTRSSSTGSGC